MTDIRCTACGKVIPDNELEVVDGMNYCLDCKIKLRLDEIADVDEDNLDEDEEFGFDDEDDEEDEEPETVPAESEVIIMEPKGEYTEEPIIVTPNDNPEPEPETERLAAAPIEETIEEPVPEPTPEPVADPEPVKEEPVIGVTPEPFIEDTKDSRFKLKRRREKKEKPKKEKKKEDVEIVYADPDSFRARWDRAMLMAFHNYVILRTITRDAKTGEFLRTSELVPYSELPEDAVACTGEKKVYCVDKIKSSDWYMETHSNYGMDCYEA